MKDVLKILEPYWKNDPPVEALANWPPKENYYEWYAFYASLVKPERILEIGVAYGWSAMAFLAGWPHVKEMFLVDNGLYGIHPRDAELKIMDFCIDKSWAIPDITSIMADSKKIEAFIGWRKFDLVHVDGEHSAAAVRSDILLALDHLTPRGVIIVDDTTGLWNIQTEVRVLRTERPDLAALEVPTATGHTLLWRKEPMVPEKPLAPQGRLVREGGFSWP